MPRKRGRGRSSLLSSTNGIAQGDMTVNGNGYETTGHQNHRSASASLGESVRNALGPRAAIMNGSASTYLDAAASASMLQSQATSQYATSENSRRSSASGSMLHQGGEDAEAIGLRKRKRREESNVVDSNYSLRNRRIRPDALNGDGQSLQPSREPSLSHGLGGYVSAEIVNEIVQNGIDHDIATTEDIVPEIIEPPTKKRRGRSGRGIRAQTPIESNMPTPGPGTPMNGHDLGTGVNTDQEPAKQVRRIPGRRRAPHSNNNVEADLRRQLQLKIAFRAVKKALIPVLQEITDREVKQLEDDEEAHMKVPGYQQIQSELRAALDKRLGVVDATFKYGMARNDKDREDEAAYINKQWDLQIANLRDQSIAEALADLVTIQAASKRNDDPDMTDNEETETVSRSTLLDPVGSTNAYGYSLSRSQPYMGLDRLMIEQTGHKKTSQRVHKAMEPINNDKGNTLDEEIMLQEPGFGNIDEVQRDNQEGRRRLIALLDAYSTIEAQEEQERLQTEASKAASAVHPISSSKRGAAYRADPNVSLQPPPPQPIFGSQENQRSQFITVQNGSIDFDGIDALLTASEMTSGPRGIKRRSSGFEDIDDPFADFPDPKRRRQSPVKAMEPSSRMNIASLIDAVITTAPEAMPGVIESVERGDGLTPDGVAIKQEPIPSPQFLTPLPPPLDVGRATSSGARSGGGEGKEGFLPFMVVPQEDFGGDGGWQPPSWPYQKEEKPQEKENIPAVEKDEDEEEEDEEEEENVERSVLLPDPGSVTVQ